MYKKRVDENAKKVGDFRVFLGVLLSFEVVLRVYGLIWL